MNNKGQTLILFLFLLPVIFLVFMAIYQVGTVELEKRRIDETTKEIVQYGIEHWSEEEIEEKMIEMVEKRNSKITRKDIEIKIETGSVKMTIAKEYSILFLGKQKIKVSYVGTNIDGKVQVVKG